VTAGLILAAGKSSRMGSPKALLDYRGETFLDNLTGLFSGFCDPVIVVVGHEAGRIRAGVRHPERALFAENTAYESGQLSSMQCGLRMVPESSAGVLFTLVDHPNVQPGTIAGLLAAPNAPLAIPRYRGRRGHPIFFNRKLMDDFLALSPDSQARQVVNRHADAVCFVDVNDPGILDDVDDAAAYSRLLETA
jgi:molybdenum cofactor cytidylyltransferase